MQPTTAITNFVRLCPIANRMESFQPGLRASPFVRSALSRTLVELISLAVSVMNGCTSCVNGHVETVKGGNLPNPDAAIDEAVRISAVVAALAAWDKA